MNKHTPGPLMARQCICNGEIAPRQFCIENERRDRMDGESWDDLYVFFSGYFGSYGPHVFAAAPELLEALESLIDLCDPHENNPDWLIPARAAIAKAKGETK